MHRDGAQSSLVFSKMMAPDGVTKSIPMTLSKLVGWDGSWTGDFDGGQTAGGSGILVGYGVKVQGTTVTFSADGFQTEMRMNGRGAAEGQDLVVAFDSCGADDLFQCPGFIKGDTLFTMHREGTKTSLVFDKMAAPDEATKSIPISLKP
jgi:hypothetical protein